MKNITLSAPEGLIKSARKQAAAKGTTLNSEFRDWLDRYAERELAVENYRKVMKKIGYFRTDRKYTREEMNER